MQQMQSVSGSVGGAAFGQTPKQRVMEAQWEEMVRRCQSSGQTVRAWCRTNGINENTYYYRLKRLRKKALGKYSLKRASAWKWKAEGFSFSSL